MACTVASLSTSSVCYTNFGFNQRASIWIYYTTLALPTFGGTTYTIGSGGTLEAAAKCFKTLPDYEFVAPSIYELVIAANLVVDRGGSLPATQSLLAAAIKCNENFPSADLAAQMLLLHCELYSLLAD